MAEQCVGDGHIFANAFAVAVTNAEIVHGGGQFGFKRLAEPINRMRKVAFDLFAFVVQFAENVLRFRFSRERERRQFVEVFPELSVGKLIAVFFLRRLIFFGKRLLLYYFFFLKTYRIIVIASRRGVLKRVVCLLYLM